MVKQFGINLKKLIHWFHLPRKMGEAAVIAYETNCQFFSNFRVMDMVAGGQDAPLVPFSEGLLYHDPKNHVFYKILVALVMLR